MSDNAPSNTNSKPRAQTIPSPLDDSSLIMFTPCPVVGAQGPGGKKPWSRLHWGYRDDNKLTLSVATGDPNEKGNRDLGGGWIRAEFNRTQAELLFLAWDRLLQSKDANDKQEVRIEAPRWSQKDNRKIPMHDTTVIFYKKDGILSIALTSWNTARPRILFNFGEDRFHKYNRADGTPITNEEMSLAAALATREIVHDAYKRLYEKYWKPEEREGYQKQTNNQGGGNGGQQGGGQSNNQNQNRAGNDFSGASSNSTFDEMSDDIPF